MRRAAAALPLPSAQSLPRDDNDVKDGVHLARRDIMLAASADRLADADADADHGFPLSRSRVCPTRASIIVTHRRDGGVGGGGGERGGRYLLANSTAVAGVGGDGSGGPGR